MAFMGLSAPGVANPAYFTISRFMDGRASGPLRVGLRREAAARRPSIPAPDLRGNRSRASRQIPGFRVEVSLPSVPNPRICVEISLHTLTKPEFRAEISLPTLTKRDFRPKITLPTLTNPRICLQISLLTLINPRICAENRLHTLSKSEIIGGMRDVSTLHPKAIVAFTPEMQDFTARHLSSLLGHCDPGRVSLKREAPLGCCDHSQL